MRPISFLVTGIGSTPKPIVSQPFPLVSRLTLKLQTLGSNTYMSLGDRNGQSFRFNYVGDSFTFSELPENFDIQTIWTSGDNAALDGVIEAIGIQRD